MVNINSPSMQLTAFFRAQVCGNLGPERGAAGIFKMSVILCF